MSVESSSSTDRIERRLRAQRLKNFVGANYATDAPMLTVATPTTVDASSGTEVADYVVVVSGGAERGGSAIPHHHHHVYNSAMEEDDVNMRSRVMTSSKALGRQDTAAVPLMMGMAVEDTVNVSSQGSNIKEVRRSGGNAPTAKKTPAHSAQLQTRGVSASQRYGSVTSISGSFERMPQRNSDRPANSPRCTESQDGGAMFQLFRPGAGAGTGAVANSTDRSVSPARRYNSTTTCVDGSVDGDAPSSPIQSRQRRGTPTLHQQLSGSMASPPQPSIGGGVNAAAHTGSVAALGTDDSATFNHTSQPILANSFSVSLNFFPKHRKMGNPPARPQGNGDDLRHSPSLSGSTCARPALVSSDQIHLPLPSHLRPTHDEVNGSVAASGDIVRAPVKGNYRAKLLGGADDIVDTEDEDANSNSEEASPCVNENKLRNFYERVQKDYDAGRKNPQNSTEEDQGGQAKLPTPPTSAATPSMKRSPSPPQQPRQAVPRVLFAGIRDSHTQLPKESASSSCTPLGSPCDAAMAERPLPIPLKEKEKEKRRTPPSKKPRRRVTIQMPLNGSSPLDDGSVTAGASTAKGTEINLANMATELSNTLIFDTFETVHTPVVYKGPGAASSTQVCLSQKHSESPHAPSYSDSGKRATEVEVSKPRSNNSSNKNLKDISPSADRVNDAEDSLPLIKKISAGGLWEGPAGSGSRSSVRRSPVLTHHTDRSSPGGGSAPVLPQQGDGELRLPPRIMSSVLPPIIHASATTSPRKRTQKKSTGKKVRKKKPEKK